MPDLLERDDELRALCRAFDEAAHGRGSVAVVAGEPGIGKTALVAELARHLEGRARVLVGVCDDLRTPRPLGPFHDFAAQLSSPLTEVLDRPAPHGTFATHLLEDVRAEDRPTVLVVEDVHWADSATLDTITVLGRRTDTLRVLLVLTLRPGEMGPDHPVRAAMDSLQRATATQIVLQPLSRGAVAALAGGAGDEVFALAGGNPFFVTEMVASGCDGTPPSLANAVLGRVARLPPASRELLELISMAPGRLPVAVLDLLRPDWPVVSEPAERRQLLTADARYARFRHELSRVAIRSSVPPARRRRLHGDILDALLAIDADPVDLVHHAEAAGDADVVAQHALRAARRAHASGANREAFAHYGRAVRFTDRLAAADEAALLEEYATSAYLVGRVEDAVSALNRSLELSADLGDRASTARRLTLRAHLHWFRGEGGAAWGDASAARSRLSAGSPALLRARAYVQSSELAMLAGRSEEALRWARKAFVSGGEDPEVHTRALTSAAAVRMQLDVDDTVGLERALEVATSRAQHHHAVLAMTALAFINLQWVRPGSALVWCQRGRSHADEHELRSLREYLDSVLAWLLLRRGDTEGADRLLSAVTPPDPSVVRLQAMTVRAEKAVRFGHEDADGLLEGVVEVAERTGELKRVEPVLELEVERALTCGRPLPRHRFRQVQELVGHHPEGWAAGRMAAWASLCGLTAPPPAPDEMAAPHAAMVVKDWRAAAEAFGAVGWQHDQALMLSLLPTRAALRESLDIARRCGAAAVEHRAAQQLRRLGHTVPRGPRRSSRTNPAGLTDRQVEVLALLGDGLTNAEIAETLVISTRTAEHHVTALLHKLGVSSRAAAVAWAADQGLRTGGRKHGHHR